MLELWLQSGLQKNTEISWPEEVLGKCQHKKDKSWASVVEFLAQKHVQSCSTQREFGQVHLNIKVRTGQYASKPPMSINIFIPSAICCEFLLGVRQLAPYLTYQHVSCCLLFLTQLRGQTTMTLLCLIPRHGLRWDKLGCLRLRAFWIFLSQYFFKLLSWLKNETNQTKQTNACRRWQV